MNDYKASKPISPYVLKPSKLQLASNSTRLFITTANGNPPKDLDFDMASHVSNAILSFSRFVFVDEEGV